VRARSESRDSRRPHRLARCGACVGRSPRGGLWYGPIIVLCLLLLGCASPPVPGHGGDPEPSIAVVAFARDLSECTPWRQESMAVPRGSVDVIPLVSYDLANSRWIPGEWYDGTAATTPNSADIIRPREYWTRISRRDLRCTWDSGLIVSGLSVVSDEDVYGMPVTNMRGTLSGDWPGGCALLVTNISTTWTQAQQLDPESAFPCRTSLLRLGTKAIEKAAGEFKRESVAERLRFDPRPTKPVQVASAVRFKMSKAYDCLWIALTQEFPAAADLEAPSSHTGFTAYYYGIAKVPAQSEVLVLWQHCSFDRDGNIGTFFRFLGAADINGDGAAEVALQEYAYERSVYRCYELRGPRLVQVAQAYDVGL